MTKSNLRCIFLLTWIDIYIFEEILYIDDMHKGTRSASFHDIFLGKTIEFIRLNLWNTHQEGRIGYGI